MFTSSLAFGCLLDERVPNANVEHSTPRPRETPSVYPYPNLSLPHPNLSLDFRISLKLGDRIPVGSNSLGRQTWISFTGGSFSGSWGTGIVLVIRDPSNRTVSLLTDG